LGDREENLRHALEELARHPRIRLIRHSAFYETEPAYVTDQPRFLNAAAKIETDLEPKKLLAVVKEIEKRLGRTETFRWGPRVIDIDLLLYDDREVHEEGLEIPHPRMWERDFVLIPWREIAPEKVPDGALPLRGDH